jgi:hypothetical protein
MPRKKKFAHPPLNYVKKNIYNVGSPQLNPHVPYQRRLRCRNRLLPIDKSITNFVLTKPPFKEGLNFATAPPPKPADKEIGSMMFVSPTKHKRPNWDVERTTIEWPTYTVKSWQRIVAASPYLNNHEKIRQKIAKIKGNKDKNTTKLNLSGAMRIGGLKLASLITGSIRFNKNLLVLNLSSCSLNSDAIGILSRALTVQRCPVETFILDHNFIQAEGCKYISALLRKNSTLKHLSLANTVLTDMSTNYSGIDSIAVGLRLNSSVELFNVSSNGLQRKGSMILVNVLQFNWRLELINLKDNHLCNDDALTLCTLIKRAELEMEDYRNSIKLNGPEILLNNRTFHLGDIEMQPSLLIQHTRWEQKKTITEETCVSIELAGVALTGARVNRMKIQKVAEAARFRLPNKVVPPYVPPPSSSAWEVLGRLRPDLGKRVAALLEKQGLRVPENYADEDWHLSEAEKVEKKRVTTRESLGLTNSNIDK